MSGIHPTAVVAPGARLGEGVEVGPYCVVGPEVVIGAGTRLMAHVVVDGCTTLGVGCTVFPFVCVGTQTQDLKFRGGRTSVRIGDRTTLREYVTVNAGTNEGEVTQVGSDCHIMAYCHVAHACTVGDRVIMANGATLAGEVVVEDDAVIGGLSGVHQFCRIGHMCMVGGMTKITQDCPPYMLVDGNPASVHGPNVVKLKRKGASNDVLQALKQAYRLLYREGLSTTDGLQRIRAEISGCEQVDEVVRFVETSERGIVK